MDATEEVKSKLDVVDIVAEYLPLKTAGTASFRGLCPFHQEKTPSFFVNRARQSWHCFGCDQGGDMISFVMAMEGLEFRDALEHLAQKAGVTLPHFNAEQVSEKKRLYEVNELASKFFRYTLLKDPSADHARTYAESRGIDNLTGDIFKIGYATQSWDALTLALKAKGVTEAELIKAGLAAQSTKPGSQSRVYDRFRDRLMFTIQDVNGHIVGFTGRLLNPSDKEGKYVNTPETSIYKKSAVLYGLDKAKGEIKSQDLAVISEGNMDVLSSHRVGISNVVCSSGTALSSEQLKLLHRFTTNLAIAFDADAAGNAATLRGLDLARTENFNIKIIELPPEAGKDPDDAIMKSPELWKRAIADAKDILEWIFTRAFKNRNALDPTDKRLIASEILPEIKRIRDPIIRDHWLKRLAEGLGVSDESLIEALRGVRGSGIGDRGSNKSTKQHQEVTHKPEHSRLKECTERLLALIYQEPALLTEITAESSEIMHPDYVTLYTGLKKAYTGANFKEVNDPSLELDQQSQHLLDYIAILADREFRDQHQGVRKTELQSLLESLRSIQKTTKRLELEDAMRAAEMSGDTARVKELALQFQMLI